MNCRSFISSFSTCSHSQDVGVACYPTGLRTHDSSGECIIIFFLPCSSLAQCNTTGETRLVGGRDKYEGRVEICLDGTWGTVDRYLFSYNDSVVVCRSLGFPTVGELLCDAKFSTLHVLHFLVLLQSFFNGI